MPLDSGIFLLDRYRIEHLHQLASESAVYCAHDTRTDSVVAVKENLISDPAAGRHFALEASILATLRHPNIPRGLDYFIVDNGQFLVMEFIEGEEIADWNARNSPSAPELVSVLGGLFDAVTHLHSLKPPVIHRDIEPSNILLTARLSTYLVDFGQAKRFQPPNVFLSEGVLTDQRTDQYSLAATIYTLLIGFPPPDSMQRLESETAIPSISASRPDVSSRMEQAVIKALSLKPSDRHMDVQAFRRSLGR